MSVIGEEQFNKLIEKSLPALESKRQELISLGYEDVTAQLIVDCLLDSVWKNNRPSQIHKIVQDILNLKSAVYMTFMTTRAHMADDDLMSSITTITGENEAKT